MSKSKHGQYGQITIRTNDGIHSYSLTYKRLQGTMAAYYYCLGCNMSNLCHSFLKNNELQAFFILDAPEADEGRHSVRNVLIRLLSCFLYFRQ